MKHFAWTLAIVSILLAACGTSATPAPTQAPAALPPTQAATFTSTPLPTATATLAPSDTATPMPGIGSRWTRPADGMVMAYVPAGAFEMGSLQGMMNEKVVHTVTLDAFWIDLTEVTNGMYGACVQAGKCEAPAQDAGYSDPQYRDHPVTRVSWDQANAYCEWAGTDEGGSVRLPTEAEWEKAARGEDGRDYPWGNEDIICSLANFTAMVFYPDESIITTKDIPCVGNTAAVGSLPEGASPYGALDMAGNAAEWVADWFGDYPASAVSNPSGAAPGAYRLTRGGAFDNTPTGLRAFARNAVYPDVTQNDLGFRCARTP